MHSSFPPRLIGISACVWIFQAFKITGKTLLLLRVSLSKTVFKNMVMLPVSKVTRYVLLQRRNPYKRSSLWFRYFSSFSRSVSANFVHLSKFVVSLASLYQSQVHILPGNAVNMGHYNPTKPFSDLKNWGPGWEVYFYFGENKFWYLLFLQKMSPTVSPQGFT